jgi:Holliday junction resolvasome RuvABC endonuclease subunit
MVLAGIDQSFLYTGITIFDIESRELLDFTVIKSKKTSDNQEISNIKRINDITKELKRIFIRNNVSHVSIEGLALKTRNSTAARPLAGLFYSICVACYELDIKIFIVPPKSVKKFGTMGNNGNADKKELAIYAPKEVKERFSNKGFKISTGFYDLIDSYFIAQYTLEKGDLF